jgi:hypothetical protein
LLRNVLIHKLVPLLIELRQKNEQQELFRFYVLFNVDYFPKSRLTETVSVLHMEE